MENKPDSAFENALFHNLSYMPMFCAGEISLTNDVKQQWNSTLSLHQSCVDDAGKLELRPHLAFLIKNVSDIVWSYQFSLYKLK